MNEFEKLVQEAYATLLSVNTEIHNTRHFFELMFKGLPETVVDKESLRQLQVDDLFEAVNHTVTATGAATLYRSLLQPLTSLELINAKQESLRELESNDGLRDSIDKFLKEFKEREIPFNEDPGRDGEDVLYDLLSGRIYHFRPYTEFKSAMGTGVKIFNASKDISRPKSRYLEFLVSSIQDFGKTNAYRLMRGPVYRTFGGIKSREDLGLLTPRWKFLPRYLNPSSLVLLGQFPIVASQLDGIIKYDDTLFGIFTLSLSGFTASGLYMMMTKAPQDYHSAIRPLINLLVADSEFQSTIDSVGKLDEIISFHKYANWNAGLMGHQVTLPKLEIKDSHYFRAKGIKNPILSKNDKNYVPNDIELKDCELTFVTGPNSAGKTTISKTVAQTQIMAQTGCYVPAESAEMAIADRIFYQYYLPDRLQHPEGDFGVNLERTRDIFYATTPRSLVVLNVLASGTTVTEEMEQAYGILSDFAKIGNNTIYVTHRHELAEKFRQEGLGQFLMTQFKSDKPTYRFVPGISSDSHAAAIAKKIRFSPSDRQQHLKKMGYR